MMRDDLAFLYQKADEVRAFAAKASELTSELRSLADFIEEQIDEQRPRRHATDR